MVKPASIAAAGRVLVRQSSGILDFPFESEAHRHSLWEENKDRLISEIWEKSFYDNGFYYFENRFIGETPFPDAFHEYEKGCARCSRRALESSTP